MLEHRQACLDAGRARLHLPFVDPAEEGTELLTMVD